MILGRHNHVVQRRADDLIQMGPLQSLCQSPGLEEIKKLMSSLKVVNQGVGQ